MAITERQKVLDNIIIEFKAKAAEVDATQTEIDYMAQSFADPSWSANYIPDVG